MWLSLPTHSDSIFLHDLEHSLKLHVQVLSGSLSSILPMMCLFLFQRISSCDISIWISFFQMFQKNSYFWFLNNYFNLHVCLYLYHSVFQSSSHSVSLKNNYFNLHVCPENWLSFSSHPKYNWQVSNCQDAEFLQLSSYQVKPVAALETAFFLFLFLLCFSPMGNIDLF